MTDKKCTAISPADLAVALDWDDLRFFLALARYGGLSPAARAMGVNHATISRRLASLQRRLGVDLMTRRPTGYELTRDGQAVLDIAGGMESLLGQLPRFGGAKPDVGGLVRLSATRGMVDGFLIPRLADLRADFPGIEIELMGESRSVSLSRHEADIALRLNCPQDGDIIARLLLKVGSGFYANQDWLQRLQDGQPPCFVAFDDAHAHIPDCRWLDQHFPAFRRGLRVGNQFSQALAAANGLGIALLPHFLAVARYDLQPVDLGKLPPSRDLWVLTRRHMRSNPAHAVVMDFLMTIFERERGLFDKTETRR